MIMIIHLKHNKPYYNSEDCETYTFEVREGDLLLLFTDGPHTLYLKFVRLCYVIYY